MSEQQRNHFRVHFNTPLLANMSIVSIKGIALRVEKKDKVKILDLSAGGARVRTKLDYPQLEKFMILLEIRDDLLKKDISGTIIRKTVRDNEFEYGISFVEEQSDISTILQKILIRQKRGSN